MAKLTVNRGSTANDGTGDNLRDGANKVNLNFDEIYTAIGDGTTVNGTIKIHDDSSTETIVSANGEVFKILGGTGITSTISGNNLTLAVDGTVLSASQVSTLTNKSIDLTDNTLTGTTAEFNTALTDNDFATLAGTEALTNKTINASSNTLSNIVNANLSGSAAITNANLANSSISVVGDDSSAQTISLGETLLFTGGSGITTSISGNEITFATDGAVVTETSTDTLTNKTINGPDNTLTNIANGSLANSSLTIGADTIALGGTQTTITDLNLDGTSSLSGTGTISTTGSANKIRFNYATTGDLPSASTYEGMFAYDIGGNNPYVADAGGWVKLITENASIADISNVGSIASISNGQVLVWNSSAGRFDPGNQGSGLSDVVDDTTPQLGGGLDTQANYITDASYLAIRAGDTGNVVNTITVTVATKTTEHPAHGTGSSSGYVLDGIESPALTLAKGTYKFDQSDSSNSGHPLLFYYDVLKARAWTTDVTTNGTPGSAGAYTQIDITSDTPRRLAYQCSSHARMGHEADVQGGKSTNLNIETDRTNTGDGSTTTITLNTNDRDVDDVLIIVNGIVLTPTDDYTISGTTLTFTSAPAASAGIVVRYLG